MERTTPVSNGWMTLVRPLGTIFPLAAATMSIVPHQAQASAAQNSRIRTEFRNTRAYARANLKSRGDGGQLQPTGTLIPIDVDALPDRNSRDLLLTPSPNLSKPPP